jgi:hypothetical protein
MVGRSVEGETTLCSRGASRKVIDRAQSHKQAVAPLANWHGGEAIRLLSTYTPMNAYTVTGQFLNLAARNAWLWSEYSRQWSRLYDSWSLWCVRMK